MEQKQKNYMAHDLKRASEQLKSLRRTNQSLAERMDLVYALIDMARGPCRPPQAPMGCEEAMEYSLDKIASELEIKEQEQPELHFPGRVDGGSGHPENADGFMGEVRLHAADIIRSAEQAMAADDPHTRSAFMKTFFRRTDILAKYLREVGLGRET